MAVVSTDSSVDFSGLLYCAGSDSRGSRCQWIFGTSVDEVGSQPL